MRIFAWIEILALWVVWWSAYLFRAPKSQKRESITVFGPTSLGRAGMSVTILYRHPARPDEAGISYVPDDAYAAALKERLVRQGYKVVEMVPVLAAGTVTDKLSEPTKC